MNDSSARPSRHQVYEQIRAREEARGADPDTAARIASEQVDKVLAVTSAASPLSAKSAPSAP